MRRPQRAVDERPPASPAGGLLATYSPIVARYAPGPFLVEQIVTPTEHPWMNARTYTVLDRTTGAEYRALRITDQGNQFVGYWAIEQLPPALDLGGDFEQDRQQSIIDYEENRKQRARDEYRKRHGKAQA